MAGEPSTLDAAIERATTDLLRRQRPDGAWCFELEADATIPAEYILLNHFLDTPEPEREQRIAIYLREKQGEHGGWPLFHGGKLDVSCSVKAYFALKMVGDSPDAPHMARAREAILQAGGAEKSNVFTRIMLALFGQVPWRATPAMPVEILLLPRWFPFHIDKVSYWSRTVMVPLLVLMARRPRAKNPRDISIRELFVTPPDEVREWIRPPDPSPIGRALVWVDRVLRRLTPWFPAAPRKRAIDKAVAFVTERLNGEDGLGSIFPAMANALMMYDTLGYGRDHPNYATAAGAIKKLLTVDADPPYCQPCLSPIWDTGLAAHALIETGDKRVEAALRRALDWAESKQVLDVVGDWAAQRPNLRPGGWAFQFANPHYPDVDDTAVVALALDRFGRGRYRAAVQRAEEWVVGMQSRNGGWGAFDADNTHYALNHIPFADHGALLDPPTADVSARCICMLAQLGYRADHPVMAKAIDYLRGQQEIDGKWFGRWGTNYIYGTWSALAALNAAGVPDDDQDVVAAVFWLNEIQRADGGWGEHEESYYPGAPAGTADFSTASQTAWALLGLMAAGEVREEAVKYGIEYLISTQKPDGTWDEPWFTAVGFPRVFYLRYHGYRVYFPLWALARYRALSRANTARVPYGF